MSAYRDSLAPQDRERYDQAIAAAARVYAEACRGAEAIEARCTEMTGQARRGSGQAA